jgi:LacI family transcriptional regulator
MIAEKVGCSEATVSRVLNGTGLVSAKTEQAVLAALRENKGLLNRRRMRQEMLSGRAGAEDAGTQSGLIEIVVQLAGPFQRIEVKNGQVQVGPLAVCPPDRFFEPENRYSNNYHREVVGGAADEANRRCLRPIVRTTARLDDERLLADVGSPDLRGVIIQAGAAPATDRFLQQCRCPVVSLSDQHEGVWPCVATDDLPGMKQAVAHLAKLGHSRIGYLAGAASMRPRLAAFKLAMLDEGIAVRSEWVCEDVPHIEDMASGVESMLRLPERPTAIICCFDSAAVAVQMAAARLGLVIPRDLSVIGYGDQDIAQVIQPPLTTIHAPYYEMGRSAIRLLMFQEVNPGIAEGMCMRLPTYLVERASTAPVTN